MQRRLWLEPGDWRALHPWAVPVVDRLERLARHHEADLAQAWFDQTAAELGWTDATRDLYARALVAAGHPVHGPATPAPWRGPRSLPLLWELGPNPDGATLRVAAWARLAAGWPAPVEQWHALDDDQVELEGDDAFVAGRRVLGGAPLWAAWRDWRSVHLGDADSGAALVTLRAANRAHLPGGRLSLRGMQDAFCRAGRRAGAIAAALAGQAHARGDEAGAARWREHGAAYQRLSYDTYRRLMLAAGAAPVDEASRGAVRARSR